MTWGTRAGGVLRLLLWPLPTGARGIVCLIMLALVAAPVVWLEALAVTGPDVTKAAALVEAVNRSEHCVPVAIDTTSPLAQATIAAEDGQFLSDGPVDMGAVIRGAFGVVTSHDAGGSTIDIQLAHLLYPSITGGFLGRVQRVALAIELDAHFSKAAILSMYLNRAYLGSGYYGVTAAARGYFNTTPNALTWSQASLLAGMLQSPSTLDPRSDLAGARQRQLYVLDRAVQSGWLSQSGAQAVAAAPLTILPAGATPGC